jgi:hypothetical protein
MKEILFLNNIQIEQQWNIDCISIANNILEELEYNLPNDVYINNFTKFLIKFIRDESICSYDVSYIQTIMEELSRESFDDKQSQNDNIEYYDFNSSVYEIIKIDKLIVKNIKAYYKDSDLLKKLKKVKSDVIFVYYNRNCKNLLSLFYTHNNPIFNSTTNSYEKSLEEIKIMISKDLRILRL